MTMNQHKWIALQTDKIAPDTRPTEAMWAIESPSPYDIPTHFRVTFDNSSRELVVEFKYIAEETLLTKNLSPEFKVEVGKRTNRIYKLRVKVDEIQRRHASVADETEHLIVDLPETVNREITIRAIDQQKNAMFAIAAA